MAEAATDNNVGPGYSTLSLYGKREMRPDPAPTSGIQLIKVGAPQASRTAGGTRTGA